MTYRLVFINSLKKWVQKLITFNNAPREIALGIAIGVFIGITPLYGFHTLLVILVAMFIPRTNKIAILAGSNISIPITAPFISWAGYSIGRLILGAEYSDIHPSALKNITYADISHILYPLFLGSLILGLISSILIYLIALKIIEKVRG